MAFINPDTLDLKEQVVRTNKVQKTNKGGRTMSWSILIVVGDGDGHVGAGIGKARAIPDAIRKGVEAAKKNIVHVPMVGSTIPHEIVSRVAAAEVMLRPASPGTGVVAGGSVRAILEAAGVRDVLAKSLGSSNPVNGAWATMAALRGLKRATNVARLRGKEVLDIISKQTASLSGIDIGYVPSKPELVAESTVTANVESHVSNPPYDDAGDIVAEGRLVESAVIAPDLQVAHAEVIESPDASAVPETEVVAMTPEVVAEKESSDA